MGNYCAHSEQVRDAKVRDRLAIRQVAAHGGGNWIVEADDPSKVVCLDGQGKSAGCTVIFSGFQPGDKRFPCSQAVFFVDNTAERGFEQDSFRFATGKIIRLIDMPLHIKLEVVALHPIPTNEEVRIGTTEEVEVLV